MNKYLQVFKVSVQQEIAYRANFVVWRIRNVIQMGLVFFLWDSVFSDPAKLLFGYNREKILTYVFGLLIIRSFVLTSRATSIAGEVAQGDLSNYLTKPLSYFRYWFSRDIAGKVLNLGFAAIEVSILFILLKPSFFFQTQPVFLLASILLVVFAMIIFFLLLLIVSSVPFWMPEAAWGAQFLLTGIFVEFLSGALFPLDVLPSLLQDILFFTPFPYMIYYPIQVYLGIIEPLGVFKVVILSGFWVVALGIINKKIWNKGLRQYQAYGR